ncbi:hypothetical protein BDF14DRAFT_1473765 [Spinellus fusiger]|nr:hypothetical protein BDF14DRAFT_1473765 [Spinellus fusiger]
MKKEVVLRGVDPKVFERILGFMHTNEILIQDIADSTKILKEADKFKMKRLISEVEQYLQLRINCSTLWEIWEIAGDYKCKDLEGNCVFFMMYKYSDAFSDPAWINVAEKIAIKALQVDNLQRDDDESVFFEAVILWKRGNSKFINETEDLNEAIFKPGSDYERLEDQIVSLECQLKNLKTIQQERKNTSTENKVPETRTTKDMSQIKESIRKEMILGWRKENAELSEMDRMFASMIYCIRFSQMRGEYIADIVENNVDVMRVRRITFLLREAYRYQNRKDKNNADEDLKSRFIQ